MILQCDKKSESCFAVSLPMSIASEKQNSNYLVLRAKFITTIGF